MSCRHSFVASTLLGATVACWFASAAHLARGEDSTPAAVDFNRDVRPIFNAHCLACHGGVKQSSGLSFIYRDKALAGGESGEPAITPGDPDASYLMDRITSTDEDRMPPAEHGPRLSTREIETLRAWIAQGATWAEHWSFVRPEPQPLPDVRDPAWCRQPLDRFVLARLEQEGLAPAPEADRAEWLRRASFDLTGLPPTLEALRAFQADASPDACERAVDWLLASPAYGERWAALWLDLARFADTQGYERDHVRTMWPYRDWVIRAFNDNLPFDQFTLRQLAGDLLPSATLDDVIATAFHRCTQTNAEGGTDDEEFRVVAAIDRANTTWEVWQGVPFKCAQCHSHPYAPIEQREFYRFLAVFNTTKDWDLNEDVPQLRVPLERKDFARAREIDRRVRALQETEIAETDRLAAETKWQPLAPAKYRTTGQTQLAVKTAHDGAAELWTEGTVSHDSKFTLDFAFPQGATRLTALRIDVLPRDPKTARLTPELGFVISELRAYVVPLGWDPDAPESALPENVPADEPPEGTSGDAQVADPAGAFHRVKLLYGLGDEAEPFGTGQQSLEPDTEGWGAEPRITCPRRLIVVPAAPFDIPPGGKLRLVIRQEDAPNDMLPLVMGRSRYSVSSDEAWSRLATSGDQRARREEWAALERERGEMKSAPLVVMAEQEPQLARVSSVFVRGNWLDKGDEVSPGAPKVFASLPEGNEPARLRVARWLVSDENPLTARVTVNRFWEQLFGLGIVETLEDFGPSGQPPSHPELLDHLALRFQRDLQWDVKRLLKEIVLSATYRQSNRVRPELAARDPRNRLLARGPRSRLAAEMVRDNALAVSGLLSAKMYGPSVMPPQPEGLGQPPYNGLRWVDATGEDRYRRAAYTFWRRTNAYPSLITFDATSRQVCTARRVATNTPLQALATLNDTAYVECAVALAERMREHAPSDAAEQIAHGYERATGRRPSAESARVLQALYDSALAEYRAQPELAAKLADSPEQAALALVANTILNLDLTLTK
jgi:mono/diheme cytochrome c family protein